MQVEVNEQNIILYGLVQLTGNSAEEMLIKAREAFANGYTLTCEVPDNIVHANTFDMFGDGVPATGDLPDSPLQHGVDEHMGGIRIDHEGRTIVVGEVIDPTSTSHIPFPPDLKPFDDEED